MKQQFFLLNRRFKRCWGSADSLRLPFQAHYRPPLHKDFHQCHGEASQLVYYWGATLLRCSCSRYDFPMVTKHSMVSGAGDHSVGELEDSQIEEEVGRQRPHCRDLCLELLSRSGSSKIRPWLPLLQTPFSINMVVPDIALCLKTYPEWLTIDTRVVSMRKSRLWDL